MGEYAILLSYYSFEIIYISVSLCSHLLQVWNHRLRLWKSYLGNSLVGQVWQDLHGDAVWFQLQTAAVQPVPKLWRFLCCSHINTQTHKFEIRKKKTTVQFWFYCLKFVTSGIKTLTKIKNHACPANFYIFSLILYLTLHLEMWYLTILYFQLV